MTAGFQSVNDWGDAQITTDDVYFTLRSVGTLSSSMSSWTLAGVNGNYWYTTVQVNGIQPADGPMFALHTRAGGAWAYVISTQNGNMQWRVFSSAPAVSGLQYYVFTNTPPPSNANGGMELFNENGGLVYASDTIIARPIGMLSSGVYAGDPIAGKKLAFSPIKQSMYREETSFIWNEGPGVCAGAQYGYAYMDGWMEMVSGVHASTGTLDLWTFSTSDSYPGLCATTTFPPYIEFNKWRESGADQALILDVTGL